MLVNVIISVIFYLNINFSLVSADLIILPLNNKPVSTGGFKKFLNSSNALQRSMIEESILSNRTNSKNESVTDLISKKSKLIAELTGKIDSQSTINTSRFSNLAVNEYVGLHDKRRKSKQVQLFPSSPIYDSLLARRTFIPSFRMVLLELSLMTLSIYVINTLENMMAAQKKKIPKTVATQDTGKLFENNYI